MAERQSSDVENVEVLENFYDEIRESARVAMVAEGVDDDTVENVLLTMDDNV